MGCGKKLANCALFLVLIVAAAFGALYFWLLPRLDGLLSDALRREFMLAPSATVLVERGSLLDTLEGQVEGLHVQAQEARIDDMNVENLVFRCAGIKFDLFKTLATGRAELDKVTSAELMLTVTDEALNKRWGEELASKGLKEVKVELTEDGISVDGLVNLAVTEARIGASGEVVVDGTEQVRFNVKELDFAGLAIGIDKLKAGFSALTPIVDLGKLQLSVVIDELETGDGWIKVTASSRTLEERQAAMQAAAEEVEEAAAEESADGSKWRVPSADEVIDLFTEDEKPIAEPAAEDEEGTAPEEAESEDDSGGEAAEPTEPAGEQPEEGEDA